MIVVSCTSHRKLAESSSCETKDNSSLISQDIEKSLAEDIVIEWTLEDDTMSNQINSSTCNKDSIKPPQSKPPKKGKIHIKIARHENINSQHITEEKKVQRTEKKTEEKQCSKPNVKKKNYNILVNSIIIIIFGFFVKYLFSHKKSLKKIWNKIKNSLTLRHP